MILAELPRLLKAIELLGLNNGANAKPNATIPAAWEDRTRMAEDELVTLTKPEMEDLVFGEESGQQLIAQRAPAANEIIDAAFDGGELSDLLMEPWRNIFDARAAERRHC